MMADSVVYLMQLSHLLRLRCEIINDYKIPIVTGVGENRKQTSHKAALSQPQTQV